MAARMVTKQRQSQLKLASKVIAIAKSVVALGKPKFSRKAGELEKG